MSYIGDFALGVTLDFKFTTRQISGAPFTLAGSPVISAYVDNSTTQITAGITLSVDFDGVTGLNNVRVVITGGNGFAAGTNIQMVITTGTVNSVSVVGEVVAEFSINNRVTNVTQWNGTAVATPATAGIPDVNVKNIDNDAASASGTVTFPNATLASTTNITGGTITTVTNLTNAPTAGDFTATMKTSLNASTPASVTTVTGNVNGSVGSVTGAVGSVTGNVGGNVNGNVVGSVASVAGNVTGSVLGNLAGSVGSVAGNVSGSVGSVAAGGIAAASFAAGAIDSAALNASAATEIAQAVKGIQMTETYAALGVAPTVEQAIMAILQKLFERTVLATTEVIMGLDGVTPVMTETLNSATTPTAVTRAT